MIDALKDALEIVSQNLRLVVLDDDSSYVTSVEPPSFKNIEPGVEVTSYLTFKYNDTCSGEEVTIRALGLGEIVINFRVVQLQDLPMR